MRNHRKTPQVEYVSPISNGFARAGDVRTAPGRRQDLRRLKTPIEPTNFAKLTEDLTLSTNDAVASKETA